MIKVLKWGSIAALFMVLMISFELGDRYMYHLMHGLKMDMSQGQLAYFHKDIDHSQDGYELAFSKSVSALEYCVEARDYGDASACLETAVDTFLYFDSQRKTYLDAKKANEALEAHRQLGIRLSNWVDEYNKWRKK